jgi:aerobic carbon-monoxide dehydrogenase small subunit
MRVDCTINGEPRVADDVWEGESLLYVLRERLGLPGSKNACEQGECGSCSVYLDGTLVCACLVAAGQVQGAEVVTVEGLGGRASGSAIGRAGGPGPGDGRSGLGPGGEADSPASGGGGSGLGSGGRGLHPVQVAFVDAGAVQCGFCTPGLIVATHDLLRRDPTPSDARIREALAGNLCRCTGYEKILDAVHLAADRMRKGVRPGAPGASHPDLGTAEGPSGVSGRGRPDPAIEEDRP